MICIKKIKNKIKMLSSQERIISILICVLLAIIIKANFFNNSNNNIKISESISYYEENPSTSSPKISNTNMYK